MTLLISTSRSSLRIRTRVQEAEAFQIAAEAAAASANCPDSIETVMRLALQAQTELVRLWARRWLQENFGVSVAG